MEYFCRLIGKNDGKTFNHDYEVIDFINSSEFSSFTSESIQCPLTKSQQTTLGKIDTVLFKFEHTEEDGSQSVDCRLCKVNCHSYKLDKDFNYKWEITTWVPHRSGTSSGMDPTENQKYICSYYKLLILLMNEKLKEFGIEACSDCVYSVL